jgi:hypothetical protein
VTKPVHYYSLLLPPRVNMSHCELVRDGAILHFHYLRDSSSSYLGAANLIPSLRSRPLSTELSLIFYANVGKSRVARNTEACLQTKQYRIKNIHSWKPKPNGFVSLSSRYPSLMNFNQIAGVSKDVVEFISEFFPIVLRGNVLAGHPAAEGCSPADESPRSAHPGRPRHARGAAAYVRGFAVGRQDLRPPRAGILDEICNGGLRDALPGDPHGRGCVVEKCEKNGSSEAMRAICWV